MHEAISNSITMVPVVIPTHAATPKITVRFPARQAVAIILVNSNISTRRQQEAQFLVVVHGMVVPSRTTIMRYIITIKAEVVLVLETLVVEAVITTTITIIPANQ